MAYANFREDFEATSPAVMESTVSRGNRKGGMHTPHLLVRTSVGANVNLPKPKIGPKTMTEQ